MYMILNLECFQIKEYRSIAKIIKFMIFNNEEHHF